MLKKWYTRRLKLKYLTILFPAELYLLFLLAKSSIYQFLRRKMKKGDAERVPTSEGKEIWIIMFPRPKKETRPN